jgi:hypothetical protein
MFQADNASMPYLLGNLNYVNLYEFIRSQQQWYLYSDRVWVQHIDRIDECTIFAYQKVETDNCQQRNPFICEIGKSGGNRMTSESKNIHFRPEGIHHDITLDGRCGHDCGN